MSLPGTSVQTRNSFPLVSVLMTAYNREKYLAFAIESVLSSTYLNFELIIFDDCSTDKTARIAQGYAEKDDRIKVYVNDKNLGDYPNRNLAANHAKGKYLKYVDSDDFIYPNALEILVKSMETFPSAGIGFCSSKPNLSKPFPFMLSSKEAYEYHFFRNSLFHESPLSSIFTREAFNAVNGFAPGRMISDIDMWHKIVLNYPVVLIQGGLFWQRRHEGQELVSQHAFIYEEEKIKWIYLKDAKCSLSKRQLQKIKKERLKKYTRFIFSGLMHFNIAQVILYIKCFLFVSRLPIVKSNG